jgi:hypothetical protein
MTHSRRTTIALLSGAALGASVVAGSAQASAPPVGPLPRGPVSTIATMKGQLVAVALPEDTGGLTWRIAGGFNGNVLQEVREQSDVGGNLVIVFKATGAGNTSINFGLTRGERVTAYQSRRFNIRVS